MLFFIGMGLGMNIEIAVVLFYSMAVPTVILIKNVIVSIDWMMFEK
ncbi:hypothetical protein [Bacillus cereus group sp. BfR-BA-01345]